MKLFNTVVNRVENKILIKNFKTFVESKQNDSIKYITDLINKQVDKELPAATMYTFTADQIKAYTTVGGTPHLDDSYTVFGEVVEGLEVIDAIAKQKVDKNNRPFTDIRMKVSIIP